MNLSKLYAQIDHEVVATSGTVIAALGAIAALTSGPVHNVVQDALPIVTLAAAWFARNKTLSLAAVADLIATVKANAGKAPASKPPPKKPSK